MKFLKNVNSEKLMEEIFHQPDLISYFIFNAFAIYIKYFPPTGTKLMCFLSILGHHV